MDQDMGSIFGDDMFDSDMAMFDGMGMGDEFSGSQREASKGVKNAEKDGMMEQTEDETFMQMDDAAHEFGVDLHEFEF